MLRRIACGALLLSMRYGLAQNELSTEAVTAENTFPSAEGPVCDASGTLFACNLEHKGTIGKITPAGEVSMYAVVPAGGQANGLQINSHGDLIVADCINHAVYRVDPRTGRFIESLTHDWRGAQFIQPNDVGIAADDTIYFTDPDFQSAAGGRIFMITPPPKQRTVLLVEGLNTPNGITVSPDQKTLYMSQSKPHNVLAYDRKADGTVENPRVFFDVAKVEGGNTALPDGIRCDSQGDLYVALVRLGRIIIIHPDGTLDPRTIRTIGKNPTNLAFCGKTLYITESDRKRIERVRLP